MKKRLIAMLLILAMVLCMVPSVSAATYSGTCGANLKWSLDTSTATLRITGTGAMNDYSQNYEPWHSYNDQYTKVIVENGCTHIGSWAFGFSENLQSVSLPNSVTSLGSHAFAYCQKLVACPLPDYLTSIGERAFYDCRKMQGLDLPSTLTSIGKSAFGNCDAITVANIPGGVASLPYGVFDDCAKLETVTFGEGVESIGESVFRETAITSITLPYTLRTIGQNTFRDCTSLRNVTMLGCETVGTWSFAGCSNLRKLTLAENTKVLETYCFAYCNSLLSVRLPASVTEVKHGAFYWHQNSGYPVLEQVVVLNPNCNISDYASLGRQGICTIYGHTGSTAQAYAIEHGYNFDLIGNEKPEPSIFSDVDTSAFYANAVEWAVNNGITSGMTPTTFEPNTSCTRGQVVTFLWRAAGSPAPKSTSCNFTDVKEGAYYYKAMLWAVENGITTGMTATTFAPNATCTRAQVVTFLWRAMGKEAPKATTCNFTDVNPSGFYYKAMLWAVENGITSGMSKTTFAPDSSCTRGQVVTFLYRTYN